VEQTESFISFLEGLREDRGALAALRRGLGQPPGSVPDMYRYVVPWISPKMGALGEAARYIIAALFAYHPQAGGEGNMGQHFARARDAQSDDTAIERRFTALLAAHPDDLDVHLRQAIGFLKSKEIAVNWHRLLGDVLAWGNPDRRAQVKKEWARAFWSRQIEKGENTKEAQGVH